jgi:hypothetical protein
MFSIKNIKECNIIHSIQQILAPNEMMFDINEAILIKRNAYIHVILYKYIDK